MSVRSSTSDFEVLSRLGAGSFGTVYKVRRHADGELYVIKNVRIMELSRKEQSEAINEVQILAQLKSPFVVRYYDSFIERDSLHIVMEFCNRGDLQNLIKKAAEKNVPGLKENVVWNMCLQVILGLHYLHKKRILHRDLKTANVFLMKSENSPNYLVKIGDLGVAKLMDTSTAFANTIVGTPYYLSPELCKDLPYRDRSDCWALGVLIFECCTLKRPFEAKNQCALIMKIIESPVHIPSSSTISKELSNLILWLLQKDPDRRPCIKDILCEENVRLKLLENNFAIPEEVINSDRTNFLGTDFTNYGQVQKHIISDVAESKSQSLDVVQEKLSGIAISGKHSTAKEVDFEIGERQPKIGRLPSKRMNPKQDIGPSIRGDRVRGSTKRVLSDKAMNRYQLHPQSNHSGIFQSADKGNIAIQSDSKVQLLSPSKSFKEIDNIMKGHIESPVYVSDSKLSDAVEINMKLQDSHGDEQDIAVNHADSLGRKQSLAATMKSNNTETDPRSSMQGTNFSTFSHNPGHFSATNTTDISGPMDIEGDSEFWNTVNMHHRKEANETILPLQTVQEVEEVSPAVEETELSVERMLAYIEELKTNAIDTLGENLFWKVYDLVSDYMGTNIDGNDFKNASFLQELESVLCEESQADIEVACEVVFSIKLILALESKYDSIAARNEEKNK